MGADSSKGKREKSTNTLDQKKKKELIFGI